MAGMEPITDWMVLTIEVADNCGGANTNHFIGRSDVNGNQAAIEVAEILAAAPSPRTE
jgi:hypothetical protein